MRLAQIDRTEAPDMAQPRALGSLRLASKARDGLSVVDRLRMSGATKVAFPRRTDAVEAIVLNTSGGLTGGDRFDTRAEAGVDSALVLTTQAAERAYRSRSGFAEVRTRLRAAPGAVLHWLPQELIVFDGAALDRRLEVDLAPGAEAVLAEAIVFGRRAMGETRLNARFRDRVTLRRDGRALYRDRIDLCGAVSDRLDRPGVAGGHTALATALYAGPRAEALLGIVRRVLPPTGGASLVAPDLLAIRLLAADSFLLRRALVPVLERLTDTSLPKSWSL